VFNIAMQPRDERTRRRGGGLGATRV